MSQLTVLFMPESAYGPTNNCIGIGDVLRRLRLARGLTQELLAERTGLSVRGISDLERGVTSLWLRIGLTFVGV